LSPGNLFGGILELKDLRMRLPVRVNQILDVVARNDLKVKVDAIDELVLIEGMQKVANRITVGLILAALIVGAALLMRIDSSFHLFGYPGIAILCFMGAGGGGLILVINILHSAARSFFEEVSARKRPKVVSTRTANGAPSQFCIGRLLIAWRAFVAAIGNSASGSRLSSARTTGSSCRPHFFWASSCSTLWALSRKKVEWGLSINACNSAVRPARPSNTTARVASQRTSNLSSARASTSPSAALESPISPKALAACPRPYSVDVHSAPISGSTAAFPRKTNS
jgi:hypothetical protein